ncbi:cytoplasmic chaperone TorD family protein [Shewanella sediminis HAW-EB3]|uniref:Cytoplasmic chaperone TorD family protein n=2 Tax=Shewanella sediminis TaxID=271097 RepID=A8FT44_SHESH|nr:cytoplasmic chaperone TorD family protein [Shewanella sediminis HAW-EB3]
MKQINNQDMYVAALRVLHNQFYHSPTSARLKELEQSGLLDTWPTLGSARVLNQAIIEISHSLQRDELKEVEMDYYRLFVGPGPVLAYPWGSVYTERENLVCGESTWAFQKFCRAHGVDLQPEQTGPTDHFGLMLAILAALLEQGNDQGINELLQQHLMPWAPRMLELVCQHAATDHYRGFAKLTAQLLDCLVNERALLISQKVLYF